MAPDQILKWDVVLRTDLLPGGGAMSLVELHDEHLDSTDVQAWAVVITDAAGNVEEHHPLLLSLQEVATVYLRNLDRFGVAA